MKKYLSFLVLMFYSFSALSDCDQTLIEIENKIGTGKGAWLAEYKDQCYEKVYLIHHNPKLTEKQKKELCNDISKKLAKGKFIYSKNCDTR
jgi:hypothetical protein